MEQATVKNQPIAPSPDHACPATTHSALHIIAAHLDEVNALLENSFSSISELFLEISDKVTRLKQETYEPSRQLICDDIAQLVLRSITDMQFQDRVSQNIVIAQNVMRHAAEELDVKGGVTLNPQRKEVMLQLLNLGDIRQKFLAYSIVRGFLDASEGMPEQRPQTTDDDNIELF